MSRWWAPEQVLDEPDEVVKAAFLPLNDGNEMPSALLGVHRAVAGAISKRVSQGLIDERGLVDAMAQMRGKVVGGALEAISKSVDPTYAGLLLRDWCDAAELGALRVYRTAVSKGVAPVVAAERAAAAYGVPSESMGKYLSVAVEPKSAPSVVNDTADRVLMESISKLHRSESEPVQETVAKASAFREDDVVRHPAGSSRGGQFAPENAGRKKATRPSVLERYGLTETIPTGVQGMIDDLEEREKPVETKPSRDPRAAARARLDQSKQRRARSKTAQQRKERAARARAVGERQQATQTRPPATRTRTRAPATRASTRAQTVRDLNDYINTRQPQRKQQEEPVNPFDPQRAGNDLMRKSKYSSRVDYENLGESIVFQMPNSLWKQLSSQLDAAAVSRGGRPVRLARLGNLIDDVDGGDVLGYDEQAEASRSTAGALEVEELQHQMRLPAGNLEIDETPIHRVPGMDENAQSIYNERKVDERLDKERGNRSAVGAYAPYAPYEQDPPDDSPEAYLVTHRWTNNSGHSNRGYPLTPQVVELVVHDARGEVVGSGDSGYRSLDPDQAYRVSVDDDPYGGTHATPELMWDPKARVLVMRYHLHPVDEDELGSFGKARQWRESDVKRDAQGQFAPENSLGFTLPGMVERMTPEKPSLSETGRQQRLERTSRKRRLDERRARAARTRLVPTQREQSETRQATRAPAARAATRTPARALRTRQPLTRTATGARAELVLAPDSSYRVFDQESFHSMLETVDRQDLLDLQREGGRINLNSMMREQLFTGMDDEKSVVRRLRNNVDADLTAQETFEHNKEVVLPGYVGADHHLLQERVNRVFDENPDVAVVEIVHDDDDQIRMQWSTMPVNQQVMVDVPDEYDPDKSYQLAYVGTYQLRDLYGQSPEGLRSIGGMMDEIHLGGGFALNPTVNHYRVISPTVQRYRAEEQ